MANASEVQVPSQVAISNIYVPEDMPNRSPGWEKELKELEVSMSGPAGQVQAVILALMSSPGPNEEEYELIAGERRLQAARNLKWTTVKATRSSTKVTKSDKFSMRVAENYGREDYSPMEEARMVAYGVNTLNMTQKDVAASMGKSTAWVSQRMTALKQPEVLQQALEEGDISFTQLRDLSRVKDPKKQELLLKHAPYEDADDFKERVEAELSGKKPAKKAVKVSKSAAATALKAREQKEVAKMLTTVTKAQAKAAKEENEVKEAHCKGIAKGIAWATKMKGVSIRL